MCPHPPEHRLEIGENFISKLKVRNRLVINSFESDTIGGDTIGLIPLKLFGDEVLSELKQTSKRNDDNNL